MEHRWSKKNTHKCSNLTDLQCISCSESLCAADTAKVHSSCSLDKGVVSTAQHILGLAKSIDLTGAGALACIKIGKQPVTVLVQVRDVLICFHKLNLLALGSFCVLLDFSLCLGQSALFVCNRLRIYSPLVCRVLNE